MCWPDLLISNSGVTQPTINITTNNTRVDKKILRLIETKNSNINNLMT